MGNLSSPESMVVGLFANWWDQDDATALRIGSYPPDSKSAIANLLAGHHPQHLLEQMQDYALKILHSQVIKLIWLRNL